MCSAASSGAGAGVAVDVNVGSAVLSLKQFQAALAPDAALVIDPGILRRIAAARVVVDRFAAGQVPVYGLNTGLGGNLGHRIAADEMGPWQQQIIDARAVAVGPPLPPETGRAVLLYRIVSASKARSGMSPALFNHICAVFAAGISPEIPAIGSIGASDLTQNAVWARGLLGHAAVWQGNVRTDGAVALSDAGLCAPVLAPRDAMALIGHSGVTVARSAAALWSAQRVFQAARAVAALSCEGFGANRQVFEPDAAGHRASPGQTEAAAYFAAALHGGTDAPRRVQEALSFRTLAPVTGAAFDTLERAVAIWTDEVNGTSDSPVVTRDGRMLSTANFHSPALALALEGVTLAAAMLAQGAVQRMLKLCDPALSGLPRYLSPRGGASAGFVPLQKTAVALMMQVRQGAHPVCFDPPPVSDTIEDMAPQTPAVAEKLATQMQALRRLVAIEALAAAQAIEMRAAPARAPAGSALHAAIRARVAVLDADRPLGADVEAAAEVLDTHDFDSVAARSRP